MELTTLKELYVNELKDLYSAEQQILKALPKMIDGATEPKLKSSFESHLKQTEGQVERLQKIFDELGEKPTGKLCKGMQGVLAEGAEALEEDATDEVRDASLISAAQRVEHYEIAGYGCARTYAEELGESKQVKLLQETLDEEADTDKKLTKLAVSVINVKAMAGAA